MQPRLRLGIAALLMLALLTGKSYTEANPYPRRDAIVRAVEKAAPAVVNVSTEKIVMVRDPFFLDDFFGDTYWDFFGPLPGHQYRTTSLGAGVIIDPRGYILTNHHVVARASRIQVTLSDKSSYPAELLSFNQEKDIAILKVSPTRSLPFVEMGTSSDLMPGETVIAVGNPFGLGHSVSVGVLSAVGRPFAYKGKLVYDNLIQTDASINPGNSGGPLLNINGKLIGINMAIQVGAQGIGFAIPINDVRAIISQLLRAEQKRAIWVGIKVEEGVEGLTVVAVEPGSPARAGGLRPGDIILSLDGSPVQNEVAFESLLLEKKVGEVLRVALKRRGKQLALQLSLKTPPRPDVKRLAREKLGIQVQNLSTSLAQSLAVRPDAGIVVTDVEASGPAAAAGIVVGDIIARVGNQPVRTTEEFAELLQRGARQLILTIIHIERRGIMTLRQVNTVAVKLR